MPAISPPPPTATTSVSRSGTRVQHLQRHRALAGDDRLVVVGVDEGQAFAARPAASAWARAASSVSPCSTTSAPKPRVRSTFTPGVKRGITISAAQAQALRVVGHALGVVAGRHGDHAARAAPRDEVDQLVAGAALLERGGELQVLELEEDLRADDLGQRARFHAGRVEHLPLQATRGAFDVFDSNHAAELWTEFATSGFLPVASLPEAKTLRYGRAQIQCSAQLEVSRWSSVPVSM